MFRSGRGVLWKQPSEAILRRLVCQGGVWGDWSVSEVRAAFVTTFSTPHAMHHGNSDKDISALTSSLRKGIQVNVWTQAVVLIISAQNWSMEPAWPLQGDQSFLAVIPQPIGAHNLFYGS
jgi:hypothetical protein